MKHKCIFKCKTEIYVYAVSVEMGQVEPSPPEKLHKGESETNFPLTILIRMGEGFLQFVGTIHNSGFWDLHQLGQHGQLQNL